MIFVSALRAKRKSVTTLAAIAMTAAEAAATFAAAAAAEATAAATEAAAGALFFRTGFIDRQLTAAQFRAVEFFSSRLGFVVAAHGDEGETARAARHLVHSNINVGYGSELPEVRT